MTEILTAIAILAIIVLGFAFIAIGETNKRGKR